MRVPTPVREGRARARKAQPLVVAKEGDHVVDHRRGRSGEGPDVDQTWRPVFRFEGGRVGEVVNVASNQHAADRFLQAACPLSPVPERLAG